VIRTDTTLRLVRSKRPREWDLPDGGLNTRLRPTKARGWINPLRAQ
jgi:hypothetical protein